MYPSLEDYNGNFVHPRVAVGGCMRTHYIPYLVKAGVRGIVNVTGVCQRSHLAYIHQLPETIHWQMLGLWDGAHATDSTPPQADRVDPVFARMAVEMAARVVRDCSPVLIHCAGGVSRSGNMAAIAVAALEHLTPQEAIERMRVHRPKVADFNEERWKLCDVDGLVRLAREVLAQPVGSTPIQMMP